MKSFTNEEIAALFKNVAAALSIKNEAKYRFQILAYQKAADSIETSSKEIKDLIKDDSLDKLPGVGSNIKNHILELFKTGAVEHFNTILKDVPASIFPLLDIPTFGPKKAFKLVNRFKLDDPNTVVDEIYSLAKSGKISGLDSFGEKSQKDILQAIDEYKLGKTKSSRMVLSLASEIADSVVEYIKMEKNAIQVIALGSLRRKKSTIGDVDIAVSSNSPVKVIEHFISYPYKDRVIEKGDITASIILSGNKQVDLMVLKPDQLGSLLQHFTGSKEHNIALRELALKKGYSVSEKGIKTKDGEVKTFDNEEDFYKFLGCDWIPPELRENTGEIEAAQLHKLPKLIEIKEIRGDFHLHSNYPIEPSHDLGKNSMQEMVNKALELKYEYLGFSEHNPSVSNHNEEQIYKILEKRNNYIEQIKKSNNSIRIFNLLEVDILANGELALSNSCLSLLDFVIVSIHSLLRSDKTTITKRVLEGLSHPKAKILAHPSGRLINSRQGYELAWEEVFEFAVKHNKALEINAWPTRLDLRDDLVKIAKGMGVKFLINTDSHAIEHMDNMRYGVDVARRGWCEKNDVLNSMSFHDFLKWSRL